MTPEHIFESLFDQFMISKELLFHNILFWEMAVRNDNPTAKTEHFGFFVFAFRTWNIRLLDPLLAVFANAAFLINSCLILYSRLQSKFSLRVTSLAYLYKENLVIFFNNYLIKTKK